MGIQVEFNPDLALRNIKEFHASRRKREECIPDPLKENKIYHFLKTGQRNYWLMGELPLLETKGRQQLSRPLASIMIIEATHFMKDEQAYTQGKYKVLEVFKDDKIHFNSYAKIN